MTRLTKILLSVAGVALATALGGSAVRAQDGALPIDHYKVYNVEPKYSLGLPVFLRDQFGESQVQVLFLDRFANPVDKNGEGIRNFDLHYSWWRIDSPQPLRAALVGNQFGQDQEFRLGDAVYLLNPALKNPEPTQPPLPDANHYQCYQAEGLPVEREVALYDQLGTRTAFVSFPELLCNPVEKVTPDGISYPIVDPLAHLACYRIEPPVQYLLPAMFQDQFFGGEIRFVDDCLLCVPSTKNIIVPTEPQTWGRLKSLYR